jgi:TetR/AcrR family transcriptional repressor of mexJK operon
MVTRKTGRPVGRPADPEKASALVDAGWTMFLERGVEGVSVEAIAARAGVSKVTFYKHFADKGALFEAGVLRETEKIEAAQRGDHSAENVSLKETLRRFGLGLMAFLFSDPAIDFYNALSGELRRHEPLARRFYDVGPGRTRNHLATILADASERGELAIADPFEAAEHLFGLWQGFSNLQLSLGVESAEIRRTLERRIDSALDVFLRAYAVSQ